MNTKKTKSHFKLIGKTIFFPKKGILAIGDLHLGYTEMLRNQGIMIEVDQLEETKAELKPIIKNIKATSTLKKIILLGDIKHNFQFERGEFFEVWNFLKFLEKQVPNGKEDIIIIKGNHDTYSLKNYTLKDFYIQDEIAFAHGDKSFPELFEKEIKTIVTAHIHPAVTLKEPNGVKREKFKCFLIGKYKRKDFIIVPSFFSFTQGINFDDPMNRNKKDQIISKQKLKSFNTFVVGKNKIYDFGKFKNLI
jgi:putative SbcD/Mre11-related phosphoesterase